MISKMTPATPKDCSPVDVTRFHQVLGNTKAEYSEILEEYFNQMHDSLQRLDTAVNTHDHREVEMISHRCVGTSATCGMTAVVVPLRELESAGRSGRLDDAGDYLKRIRPASKTFAPSSTTTTLKRPNLRRIHVPRI